MASLKRRNKYIAASIIGVIGVALLVGGVIGIIDYMTTTTQGQTVPTDAVVTKDEARPSERKPELGADFTVPAKQPRRITIDALNVTAYIQKVGLTTDNQMATPNNIFFGGWYVGSVAPGDEGLSIVNGHAGGRYEQGVFRDLGDLKEGATFRIEMGDLSWREFSVVSVNTYDIATAQKKLFQDTAGIQKELHLITCDGVFDAKMQTYDKRTIVVAKRI